VKKIHALMMTLVLSLATLAIAHATTAQKIPPAKLPDPQTNPLSPVASPEVEVEQLNNSIFNPKAVQIPFGMSIEKGSSRQILASGTIYYSNGELFVRYDKNAENIKPNTNFATINGKLYAWETGAKQGKILKRRHKDTEELLVYLVDISIIKRSIYFQNYRETPDNFVVTQQGDTKTILFKPPIEFVAGIRIQEKPFWLKAFILCECKSITPNTSLTIFEVERPIPLEQIPKAVKALPPGVKFKATNETVDSYLIYL
jgi:hypothetical protein